MPSFITNFKASARYISENFQPQKVSLKQLEGAHTLPDILVVSDLDGSKWGAFEGSFRSAYNPVHYRKNHRG